jgi:hypothetical protein
MVSIFITAFALVLAILLLSGIGLYFWQKTARDNSERILPPNPDFSGLFAEQPAKTDMKTPEEIERAKCWRRRCLTVRAPATNPRLSTQSKAATLICMIEF